MNATTQHEQTALSLPQRAAVELGTSEHETKLRELVKSSSDIIAVVDVAGREQAHRIGMNLKGARVAIEKVGKAAREDATAFSKAIIAEEKRLIAIAEPEEERILLLRDGFDAKEKARKDALIAQERARVDGIKSIINEAYRFEIDLSLSSPEIGMMIEDLEDHHPESAPGAPFAEFLPDAISAYTSMLNTLNGLESKARAKEAAEANARAEREAEAKRVADEAAELKLERENLARERAEHTEKIMEQERQAKAVIVEQRRIEQEEKAARDREFAAQKAAHDAEMKAAYDAAQTEIKAAQDKLEVDRIIFEAQKQAAVVLAVTHDPSTEFVIPPHLVDEDHAEALAMNAQRTCAPDVYIRDRPSDENLIGTVAQDYDVSRALAEKWLRSFGK